MGRRAGTTWAALRRTEGAGDIPAVKASMPASRLDAGPANSAIYSLHAIQRGRPMRTVSLMTANQKFARLVREVERGQGFLIFRHGRPVAKLVPPGASKSTDPEWAPAHRRMMARLSEGVSLGGLRIERDGLHDRQGALLSGHQHSALCRRPRRRRAAPAPGGAGGPGAAPRRPGTSMNNATTPLSAAAKRSQRRRRTG